MINVSTRQAIATPKPDLPPLLARLLASRGVGAEQSLILDASTLPRPSEMKGMEAAVDLVMEAIENQSRILIVSDFDCDGATSCAVLMRGLPLLGVKPDNLQFIVPSRFKHGYGITPGLLEEVPKFRQPDLIITVDNGISAVDGVNAAKERGIKVLVTDHHLPGEALPDADAIINPNQPGCTFPSKNIAGVGVAFYLLMGVRAELIRSKIIEKDPGVNRLLHIVALGTVCDVVRLDELNRTFVEYGLRQIRAGAACEGLKALMNESGVNSKTISTMDCGFRLGPRINAAGRMGDMSLGINLLTTDKLQDAVYDASLLNSINEERRATEAVMQQDAMEMMENITIDEQNRAIILVNEEWHEGVIGLLASRLKEKHYRPAFIFAHSGEDDIKASCRSIPGIHIRDLIANVFANNPDFGVKFGGHAMASGLTIKACHFERFKYAINQALSELDEALFSQTVEVDGSLPASEINVPVAQSLPTAAPWGQAFPPPLFCDVFTVKTVDTMGKAGNHLRMKVVRADLRAEVVAVAFNTELPNWLKPGVPVKLVYSLNANEFMNRVTLQLLVEHLLPA